MVTQTDPSARLFPGGTISSQHRRPSTDTFDSCTTKQRHNLADSHLSAALGGRGAQTSVTKVLLSEESVPRSQVPASDEEKHLEDEM